MIPISVLVNEFETFKNANKSHGKVGRTFKVTPALFEWMKRAKDCKVHSGGRAKKLGMPRLCQIVILAVDHKKMEVLAVPMRLGSEDGIGTNDVNVSLAVDLNSQLGKTSGNRTMDPKSGTRIFEECVAIFLTAYASDLGIVEADQPQLYIDTAYDPETARSLLRPMKLPFAVSSQPSVSE